jgi:hypothetical protein
MHVCVCAYVDSEEMVLQILAHGQVGHLGDPQWLQPLARPHA